MNIAIIDAQLMVGQLLASNLERTIPLAHTRVFTRSADFLAVNFSGWSPQLLIAQTEQLPQESLGLLKKVQSLPIKAPKVILLATSIDLSLARRALREGGHGYLAKQDALADLLVAIEAVLQGRQYVSHSLKEEVVRFVFNQELPGQPFTNREQEVLAQLCEGCKPSEIAVALQVSQHTVQLHIKNLLRKCKLHRTADLILHAYRSGFYRLSATSNKVNYG